MKVGFIRIGAMVIGMARNLAKSNQLTAVYNRTSSKAAMLADEWGVIVCHSIQQLAELVDTVLICVSADADVLQVISAISKTIKPESIVIDFSTVSSETAHKAADILLTKQVHFLDAPVSGGVEGAKNGSLVIMVGGDEAVLEKSASILKAMSAKVVHIGATGAGQGAKAVNQVMAAGINQAVTEALAFGQAQDLDMPKIIEVISSGAAGNWFLQHRGNTMVNGVFDSGFKVVLHHKDLKICQEMAIKAKNSIHLVDKTVLDYEALIQQGYADDDISALYRLKTE